MVRGPLRKLSSKVQNLQRKKPGPKPKSTKDRILDISSIKPIKRVERSYSRETKIKVLRFHFLHKILSEGLGKIDRYRTPMLAEISSVFLILESTIHNWTRMETDIVQQSCGSYRRQRQSFVCKWPELEEKFYEKFLRYCSEGKMVRRGWFRRHAKQFFQDGYSTTPAAVFVFSTGWFNGFLNRPTISIRFTTNKAQKIHLDYRKLIINWLRFNRRVSQPQNIFEKLSLTNDIGRYVL